MTIAIRKSIFILLFACSATMLVSNASAQEWPFTSGDYWDVTGIDIHDGGSFKYSKWLATEWRKNLEFSKSKGWIKDYKVFANVNGRAGEPDIYLIRVMESIVSGEEGEKRQKEYQEWQTKTITEMQTESGNRAEYREVMGSKLLQELNFRE